MIDIKFTINGLETAKRLISICPGTGSRKCRAMDACDNAITLLKEQEAVKPRVSSVEQRCGNCNKVIEMDGWKACPWCGKPIDWEGWWKKNGTRNQDT